YCTSVKPSLYSRSCATHVGARQGGHASNSLIFVVSGGGSAATGLGCQPRSPAVPASVNPPGNCRRLNRRACCLRRRTSFPDASRCAPETTSQWPLLPSHQQAQHLTLALTCCRKPQRRRSVGFWQQVQCLVRCVGWQGPGAPRLRPVPL